MVARRQCSALLVTLSVVILSACNTPPPAPIQSRSPPPSERINYHLVSKGDTLFSLAWRYEKDLNKLAAANGLRSPYTLYEGQRLTMDTSRVKLTKKPVATARTKVTQPTPTRSTPSQTKPRPKSTQQTVKQTRSTSQLPKTLPTQWKWEWPVPGRVTRQFNNSGLFKGVDLQIRAGQPVHTAAPGLVVYAGNGLRGYGELIIIKHSEIYLSAYAHNKKIIVKEGQLVTKGQKISVAGGDPADRRRLYFEIRKDGKPVNPLRYLPKK